MRRLILKGSYDKPKVRFDKQRGVIKMEGSSLPENVLEVYDPVLSWLKRYSKSPNEKTNVEFFFEYVNTASLHMISRAVDIISNIKGSKELIVNWYYYAGDYDIRDLGSELFEETGIKYNLVEKSEEAVYC